MPRLLLLAVLASSIAGAQTTRPLAALEDRAEETVTVDLDGPTLRALEPIIAKTEPEDAEWFRALRGVNRIEVHSFTFKNSGLPSAEDAETMRTAMVPPDWHQFLKTTEKDPGETVTGWSGPDGLVMIVAQPGELTGVRVEGIFPEKFAPMLGRHFGLPSMRREKLSLPVDEVPAGQAPKRHVEKLNFGRVVRALQKEGLEKEHIPMLWVAAPVAFVASGGAVSGTHLAIFKNAPDGFGESVERVLPEGWSRLVTVRSHDEQVSVFVGEVGSHLHLLVATGDDEGGVLVTTSVKASMLDQEPRMWAKMGHKSQD